MLSQQNSPRTPVPLQGAVRWSQTDWQFHDATASRNVAKLGLQKVNIVTYLQKKQSNKHQDNSDRK